MKVRYYSTHHFINEKTENQRALMASPRASFQPRSLLAPKLRPHTAVYRPDLVTDMLGLAYNAFYLIFELVANILKLGLFSSIIRNFCDPASYMPT